MTNCLTETVDVPLGELLNVGFVPNVSSIGSGQQK